MIIVVVILLILIVLSVGYGSWLTWKSVRPDDRPFYWDESRSDLTEIQQVATLQHATQRRIKKLMREIDAFKERT